MSARNKDSAESAASGLASADRSRSETAGAASFSSIPGFSQLSTQALLRFEAKATRIRVRRGDVLVRQGEMADELYLVLTGRFYVMLEGKPGMIAEIGPGEPIGELAFLGGGPRTASVVAARDSDVLKLTREAYAEIAQEAPEIVSTILASVAKRLAAVTAASPVLRRRRPRIVALLPIGDAECLPAGFLERLKHALAPLAVAIVSPQTLPHGSTEYSAVAAALAATEAEADLVLLSVDRGDETLASLFLNHADELLLVAPASDAGRRADSLSATERTASELFFKEHRALVLLRDSSATPIAGTGRWLRGRDVALVHQVALDRSADIERLARFLAGSAVGLVLGGGAALGCAHLGIARALGEAGIPIDFMGGTSVGAAVAASLAMGALPDDILDLSTEIFIRKRALRWLTIPVYSIIDHRRFDAELKRHYASTLIEDLPINYFAVSANLTQNDVYVHRSGLLWEAVRASSAVPGVLPPFITEGGEVLADGALVDNVPV
ncbi:MAG: patatin-like phospholipase family protein, partial [Propylenella sp.]